MTPARSSTDPSLAGLSLLYQREVRAREASAASIDRTARYAGPDASLSLRAALLWVGGMPLVAVVAALFAFLLRSSSTLQKLIAWSVGVTYVATFAGVTWLLVRRWARMFARATPVPETPPYLSDCALCGTPLRLAPEPAETRCSKCGANLGAEVPARAWADAVERVRTAERRQAAAEREYVRAFPSAFVVSVGPLGRAGGLAQLPRRRAVKDALVGLSQQLQATLLVDDPDFLLAWLEREWRGPASLEVRTAVTSTFTLAGTRNGRALVLHVTDSAALVGVVARARIDVFLARGAEHCEPDLPRALSPVGPFELRLTDEGVRAAAADDRPEWLSSTLIHSLLDEMERALVEEAGC